MSAFDHFGVTPSTAIAAILSALSVLKLHGGGAGVAGGSGCVKTIRRYAQDKYSVEEIDRVIAGGLPAMLVACTGGPGDVPTADGGEQPQRLRFAVICAAGRMSSVDDRISNATPSVNPGVEDLLDLATYFGLRAIHGAGLRCVRLLDHKWLRIEADKYIAVAELEGTRRFDLWDDEPVTTMLSLGLVHDPIDPEELFLEDNETPNTDAPPTLGGGVVTL